MITFACSSCGKEFQVPDDKAGKKAQCRACGAKVMIPDSGTFDLAQTPAPVAPTRSRVTSPPPATVVPDPSVNLNQVVQVMFPPRAKEANALGVASVIVGVCALAGAWIPLVGVFALPLIFVGVVFAVVGFLVALTSKRSGTSWALAGLLVNLVGFLILIVVSILTTNAVTGFARSVNDAGKRAEAERRAKLAVPIQPPVRPKLQVVPAPKVKPSP